MLNLVPAKCPSCGATIEVNKDLRNVICQFCGTTVIVEETINTIVLDGIKGEKDKLLMAQKHIELNEFNHAKNIYHNILKNDHFRVDIFELMINALIKEFYYIYSNTEKEILYYNNYVLSQKSISISSGHTDSIFEDIDKYNKRLCQIDDSKVNLFREQIEDCKLKLEELKKKGKDFWDSIDKVKNIVATIEWRNGLKEYDFFTPFEVRKKILTIFNDYLKFNYSFDKIPEKCYVSLEFIKDSFIFEITFKYSSSTFFGKTIEFKEEKYTSDVSFDIESLISICNKIYLKCEPILNKYEYFYNRVHKLY